MINFTAGENVSIVVPFTLDGEYVSPDANSVTYSLRDNAGALISTATDIAATLAAGATETVITLASTLNAKTLLTEKRTLVVKFAVNAHPQTVVVPYRLNDWLNIAVTAEDVRGHIGLTRAELPDDEVDLYNAFYLLEDLMGAGVMSTALASGTILAQFANDALIFKAAHDLIPSMPARVLRKEGSGTTSFERFSHFDFDALHDKIAAFLDEAMARISGQPSTFPSLVVAGNRTDPVTNA